MDKFNIDFSKLDKIMNSPKVYKLADVKDKIEKVAFDIVRFRDNEDTEQLWRVEETVDGPVIVAMYDSDDMVSNSIVSEASQKTHWAAVSDKFANVNVFYKGDPITKFAASKMGIPDSEVGILCKWLPKKLASDHDLRMSLLKDLSESARELLVEKYPEITG